MSHDGDKLSTLYREAHVKQYLAVHGPAPLASSSAAIQTINLAEVFYLDQRFAGASLLRQRHQNILNLSLLPDFSLSVASRIIRLSPSLISPSTISVKLLSEIPVFTSTAMGLPSSTR